eukprot:TRINITY_DN7288_c0_g1_i1.p1 TRINITY_DN7288_c0_g1~~TRINITY_DN7288_c0_g1_i1.p1  ORF type:complete len:340 (+),score=53.42 TRINITY_DN7288_c0_g1_i1:34-1053(+)
MLARRIQRRCLSEMAEKVLKGDRRTVSRAITLIESSNENHRREADLLLQEVANFEGRSSFRIAISGPPGAGKSCFIEALGTHLTENLGKKVAVLTIDPSSTISGGSLLGDKTRMDKLSINPNAYVRPSPTKGCLGGVAEATYDSSQLCEAAGFDVIIIETVGVGQSEVAARNMSDCFLLMLPPSSGDELQGIKKGIVEVADIVCITKADGSTEKLAKRSQVEYRKALQLIRPFGRCTDWRAPVLTCSSKANKGISELWEKVMFFASEQKEEVEARRHEFRVERLWDSIRTDITRRIESDQKMSDSAKQLTEGVRKGDIVPRLASRKILDAWLLTQTSAA